MVLRREEGVIPMGFLSPRDHHVHAIGGMAGLSGRLRVMRLCLSVQ